MSWNRTLVWVLFEEIFARAAGATGGETLESGFVSFVSAVDRSARRGGAAARTAQWLPEFLLLKKRDPG